MRKKADRLRKDLITFFKEYVQSITATTTIGKIINSMDVTFDLSTRLHKPYTKVVYNHRYIIKQSNYYPRILNNLHRSNLDSLPTLAIRTLRRSTRA